MQITRRTAIGAAAAVSAVGIARRAAAAPVEIEMFFPVPVQGKLAVEMQRLIGVFNASHPEIKVTPAYTGSYDQTNVKTRAAITAGKPPRLRHHVSQFHPRIRHRRRGDLARWADRAG